MSYGLQVKSFDAGGGEITQIDTTKGYIQYVVTKVGYGTYLGPVGNTARVFVKPQTDANGNYIKIQEPSGDIRDEYELCIKDGYFVMSDTAGPRDGISWENSWGWVNCHYIVIEDVTQVTPSGDYGLQTLTAGNDAAFDSRRIKSNTNLVVNSVIPAGALGGAGGTTDVINNDSSKYISLSGSFWDTLGTQNGILVMTGTQQTRYWHRDWLEPTPSYQTYPYYYDNFGPIWIVEKV